MITNKCVSNTKPVTRAVSTARCVNVTINQITKCDRDLIWSDEFNLNMFAKRHGVNVLENPMLDFTPHHDQPCSLNADMLDLSSGNSKEYYKQMYPLFNDEICTIFEWISCGKWNEMKMLLKVKQREEKLRRRREQKKKMKELGIKYNSKKSKMKKIKKNVTLEF